MEEVVVLGAEAQAVAGRAVVDQGAEVLTAEQGVWV